MTNEKRIGNVLLVLAMLLALLPTASIVRAAEINLPDFSGLAAKAKESVDIDLDKEMLRNAGSFMTGKVPDAELAKQLEGLEHVTVKVFSFDKPGQYSIRDIDNAVEQVQKAGWKKMMSVRDGEDRVEMWMGASNSPDGGMFFVASEPDELVMINIRGKVDLATLSRLQGRFGMPNMGIPVPPSPPAPAARPAPAAQPAPPSPPSR
jgi:hypothetical protein